MQLEPNQAEDLADQMLADARAASEVTALRTERRRATFARFHTGLVTLVGYFAGSIASGNLLDSHLLQATCGVVTGLLAAVVFAARGPNNSMNRTPLRGAGYLNR